MSISEKIYDLNAVAVTPDQRFIIGGGGNYRDHPGCILFWDFKSGSLVKRYAWSHYVLASIIVTPDSRLVVISGRQDRYYHEGTHFVGAIDIATDAYREIKSWDHGSLCLLFSWDKKYLRFDDFVWDWQAGGQPELWDRDKKWLDQARGHIELAPNRFISSDDQTFLIKDIETNQTIFRFGSGHNNQHHKFAPIKITHDRRYLLSQRGCYDNRKGHQDPILGMWDMQTGDLLTSFESCRGAIKAIDVTANSQYVVVLVNNPGSVIKVINLETGNLISEIHPTFTDSEFARR